MTDLLTINTLIPIGFPNTYCYRRARIFATYRALGSTASNENTNRRLRPGYPKVADVSGMSQTQLDTVVRKLNARPRETLHCRHISRH